MRRAATAGTFSVWRTRCVQWRGWPALRYLLVWPLIQTYRDCVRRSLRWRLAESHVGTILFSVAAVSLIGAVASVASAFIQRPMEQEPANEAKWVAEGLQRLGWVDDLSLVAVPRRIGAAIEVVDDRVVPTAGVAREAQTNTSALLAAMASGEISPNPFTEDVNLDNKNAIGKALANVSSISIVGQDQTVLASSAPILNGRSALLIGPAALGVAQSALSGEESTAENTRIVEGLDSITGAYPLRGGDGRIFGAVVVDKAARTLPSGFGFAVLVLEYVGELALRIALLIGLPAIPIGLLIGIRRARAIGRPITALAVAADAIAGQQLDARVPVDGDDELATLGRRFNQMAERLQESLGREAAARERAERLLAANRELIANVSHELRTPVALVRAHLESLAGEPERVDEYARIALRETDRLDALVADLFQLARIEGQGVE
ncbi:MAG: HAMP domain-containing protein, partial [Chloroflexota bacterium]|nr:HAMP domain-containing protein [Chloroflexota bacterium]